MILIYAPYPDFVPDDGWGRRIRAVHDLFKEKEKIYIWPQLSFSNRPELEQMLEAKYFKCDFRRLSHRTFFSHLLRECEFLYAHTVHSSPFLYPFYKTGKIITDLHGVAPEEDQYAGNLQSAAYYDYFERELVRGSYLKIAVTQSMIEHYVSKYGDSYSNYLLFPVSNEMKLSEIKEKKQNSVIYAGGAQVWQKVDAMFEAMEKAPSSFSYTILSHQSDLFEDKLKQRKIKANVTIDSVSPQQVYKFYETVQFGFLLRDNVLLNNVACPTKLIEYLSYGIIPIMESPHLGDFGTLGGRYIDIQDFINGNLPSKVELKNMVEENLKLIKKINEQIFQAQKTIRQFSSLDSKVDSKDYEFMPMCMSGACGVFPITAEFIFLDEKKTEISSKSYRDICFLSNKIKLIKPKRAKSLQMKLHYSPVLIQDIKIKTKEGEIYSNDFQPVSSYQNGMVYFGNTFNFYFFYPEEEEIFFLLELADIAHSGQLSEKKNITKCLTEGAKRLIKNKISKESYLYKFLRKSYKGLKRLNNNASNLSRKDVQSQSHLVTQLQKIDVIIQCDNFLSGGLENVVIEQLKVFAKFYKVLFLVFGATGSAFEIAKKLPIQVLHLRYDELQYEQILSRTQPKLVLMNYSFFGIRQCHEQSIVNIQVIHNLYTWLLEDNPFNSLKRYINHFIAVSQEVKDFSIQALKLPNEKISIIENGIKLSPTYLDNLKNRKLYRKELIRNLNLPEDSFIFLCPASYTQQKNILGLLKAFKKALTKNPALVLLCMGSIYDDNLYSQCCAYVKNNDMQEHVRLLGKQSGMGKIYAAVDAGIISSYYEGGPLVFLEMLAYDLPVLSTEVGVITSDLNIKGVQTVTAPFKFNNFEISYECTFAWIEEFAHSILKFSEIAERPKLSEEEKQTFNSSHRFQSYLNLVNFIEAL